MIFYSIFTTKKKSNVSFYSCEFITLHPQSRTANSDNDITFCRAARDPYLFRALQPGTYHIRARALTPAGNGSWSEPIKLMVEIPEAGNNLILPLSIGMSVLFVLLVAFIVYYAFYRR